MKIKVPCIECGVPADNTRCDDCDTQHKRAIERRRPHRPKQLSAQQRGYDSRWRRLSERARQLQPFCSDCGAKTDLQADHTPEAWKRHEQGLAIRLKDIDVVCAPCNRKRGAARGDTSRSKATNSPNDTGVSKWQTKPSQSHTD